MVSTKNKRNEIKDLLERASFAESKIDDGVITGVKLLGERSRNGNVYPTNTRQRSLHLLEGQHVNLNHNGKGDVPLEKRIGKLVNIRNTENGCYGDFQYLKSHPFAATLIEAAQRMPDVCGFSINARGTGHMKGKDYIVESLDHVRSVDLVADPATCKSLFESEMPEGFEAVDPDAAMAEAFCQAIVAVCKSGQDMGAKLKRIKEILKAQEKLGGGEEDEGEEMAEPEKPEAAEESYKQEYELLKLEKQCRALCESCNVAAEEKLLNVLVQLKDDETRKDHLKYIKKQSVVKPVKSSGDTVVPVPATTNWAQRLREYKEVI